jgi:hypothetical protein
MPIRRKATEAGVFQPADLGMLSRVFDATAVLGETEEEREVRAAKILRHFEEGMTDEATLRSLVKRK